MNEESDQPIGVIGAGSFGTAVATLLSLNNKVLLFTRSKEIAHSINTQHQHRGIQLSSNIHATNSIEGIAEKCSLIFPVVPSKNFRAMMQLLGPHLEPKHILIHATKGFDLSGMSEDDNDISPISRKQLKTMSEVIMEESSVLRVGCLSGPNLAKEILEGQPTATVIASQFLEVVELGQKVLSSDAFFVFGTKDIIGAELAGALKNIIALGSGLLYGKAMLITRGLHEMIHFGNAMGAQKEAFLGTAGIADLVATSTSKLSRNFTFGRHIGSGKTIEEAIAASKEVAEGARTLKIAYRLAKYYELHVPITETLYNVVYGGYPFDRAIEYLKRFPYTRDVDFL